MNTLSHFLDLEEETKFDFESELPNLIEKHQDNLEVKYRIYIPSKGRAKYGQTAKLLDSLGITNYRIVIEPQDYDEYLKFWPSSHLLVLPENDRGISYSRSFIKNYSHFQGEEFHWQMDDDMNGFKIRMNNKNVKVDARSCFNIVETVCDKFDNVVLCGITHFAYAFAKKTHIAVNRMGYGVVLIKSNVECDWRPETNEDLDFSLQLLEKGYVTLAFNSVLFDTLATGKLEGGNQLNLFAEDGRKKIYENTAKLWPGRFVVKQLEEGDRGWTLKHIRRFYNDYKQRPQLKKES